MPRKCKVCTHEYRDLIETLIIEDVPYRRISSHFGMSETSIRRHVKNHFWATLAKAREAKQVAQGDFLINKILELELDAKRVMAIMEKEGDTCGVLSGIGELRRLIELLAKLRGDIQEMQTVNIFSNPDLIAFRTKTLHVLRPFPDARTALIEVWEDYDGHRETISNSH